MTLSQVWEAFSLREVALLKVDCEGCESEVLPANTHLFPTIGLIRTELHGRHVANLTALLQRHFGNRWQSVE